MAAAASQNGPMILLSPSNRILEDIVSQRIKKVVDLKEPCDARLCDFDDVSYHISVNPEVPGIMDVSMTCSCYDQIKGLGADSLLQELYGPYVVDPVGDANVTLRIDLNQPIKNPEELIKSLAQLKTNIVGAPINYFLSCLQKGEVPNPAKVSVTKDASIFFFPKADRCTLVYSLDFADKSDLVIAKVFLNAFVEARRTVPSAPICSFDVKPPMEMKHFGIEEPTGNIGFLAITLLKEHVAAQDKKVAAVGLLHMLRNYIKYHIKCSKAYFHSRMRARVVALLQVMNRARMEDLNPKQKKTASGRNFVQQ